MSEKVERVDTSLIGRMFPTFGKAFGRSDDPRKTKVSSSKGPKGGAIEPRLPMVNLLPPRLAFEKAKRASQRMFLVIGVGMLVASALLWVGQAATISIAQRDLDAANKKVTAALADLSKLGEESSFFAALDYRLDLEKNTLQSQVDQQKVLNLVSSSNSGATLGNASITMIDYLGDKNSNNDKDNKNPAAKCGPTDPFAANENPLACLKFDGTATSRTTLNSISQKLIASGLLSNVTLTQTGVNTDSGIISFTVTASVKSTASVKIKTTATGGNL